MRGGQVQIPPDLGDAARILVEFEKGWGLGDLLCAEPMLRGLREQYPFAEIRIRGAAGNAAYSPAIDGAAPVGWRSDARVLVPLFRSLGLETFALFEALPSLSGHFCAYAGVSPSDPQPRLNLQEEDWHAAQVLGLERLPRPLVAVCADGSDALRAWPVERFAGLAEQVQARGGTVIECGLRQRLGLGLDLVGRLPIRGLAAVLSHCDLFVGNNSGLFHYAQAAGVPSLVLFSVALPQRFVHDRRMVRAVQHQDLPCINCMTTDFVRINREGCRGRVRGECMQDLPLEHGIAALDEVFDGYLADCPEPGQEGLQARSYRARLMAGHGQELLRYGYVDRGAQLLADAAAIAAGAQAPERIHCGVAERVSGSLS